MQVLIYLGALLLVRGLQLLPLVVVALLGRCVGGLAYWVDGQHRRVALENLTHCFGTGKTPREIRALARENFCRLGENYACAVKTAAMEWPDLKPRVEFTGAEILLPQPTLSPRSLVVAIGHFGNFELYARFGQFLPAFKCLTTYRALNQPLLNRLMQSMREQSGCLFFERRRDANALKSAMNPRGVLLGLLADQHAGVTGLRLPFFGRDCSTSSAPAVFALRYHLPLFTGICYRIGLARWRIEAGVEIPTHDAAGRPRPTEDIMLDVNHAFEAAIRRDPANWFWVHKRWKPFPNRHRASATLLAPAPESTTG